MNRGFTLVEILLYLGLSAGLLLAVSLLLSFLLAARVKNQTISLVEEEGALAVERITQVIRQAEIIEEPEAGKTKNKLEARLPSGLVVEFRKNGLTLEMIEADGAPISLTSPRVNVSGLWFRHLAQPGTASSIRLEFTLARFNPESRSEYDFSQTFYAAASLRENYED